MNTLFCYYKNLTVTLISAFIILFFAAGCKKESPLSASGLDENYFVNQDNPDDPIDHAIYNFYKSTGVASFYNDTLAVQKISREGDVPERYRTIKLSLDYYPTATTREFTYVKLSSRHYLPGVLELLQTDVLPRMPDVQGIQSILYVDSLIYYMYGFLKIKIEHGFTAAYGFNTMGVVVKNVLAMGVSEKKMYAASILAGFAIKKLRGLEEQQLQQSYFIISRGLSKGLLTNDVYSGISYFGALPTPNSIALLYYPYSSSFFGENVSLPTENSDLRSFLTMVFRYSEAELYDMYKDYSSIIQKISVIRQLLLKYDYTLPE